MATPKLIKECRSCPIDSLTHTHVCTGTHFRDIRKTPTYTFSFYALSCLSERRESTRNEESFNKAITLVLFPKAGEPPRSHVFNVSESTFGDLRVDKSARRVLLIPVAGRICLTSESKSRFQVGRCGDCC